ncbi:MAG: ppsA, partial [Paenibacillaceae bacterium]|nr:ppsA [Paenibacillaceae bacterium]
MSSLVLSFQEMDKSQLWLVGGKGLNLGECSKIPGIQVPEGFCVTTAGYRKAIEGNETFQALLDRLTKLQAEDRESIGEIAGKIRQLITSTEIPSDVAEEVTRFLSKFGKEHAYAVRSSATAEDLPHASFAGQQDTFLNIIGLEAILQHIRMCWASLFTDRAVIYRIQNGFGHHQIHLAVIVQRMVFPHAAGILFTADPVTSNRKVLSIDAGFGLGEALVSGIVSADTYKVRDEQIVDKRVATKLKAIYGRKEGGTVTQPIAPEQQTTQVLTDDQILQLARLGRQIEAYFGCPQDIEWCLADNTIHIVQSRPITTLYPIPEAGDDENHVYISVGHQQMMTDPMKPLGMSIHLLITPAPMRKAGGRLFVDIARQLASSAGRETFLKMMGQHDPLMQDALATLIDRGDFIPALPEEETAPSPGSGHADIPPQTDIDPAIVTQLIQRSQSSIDELKHRIRTKSGVELFDFILEDIQELKKVLFDPQSTKVFMAAMGASAWINEHMNEWLGEKNAADTLSQSVPHNVTSEMGLALMDVADAIRPYPEMVDLLQRTKDDRFLDQLVEYKGG